MNVIVGSNNEPKRLAVEHAFSRVFPYQEIKVESVKAESGVSDHPLSSEESLKGALNRTKYALKLRPGAEYYVGIEGGLLQSGGRVWEIGFVAIENNQGEIFTGISAGLELKGKLLNAILNGQELNEALLDYHGHRDAGKANGYYGLTTNNLVTRMDAYIDAIIFALAPFKNSKYFK